MAAAPYPPDEVERLAELRSYEILDTAYEASFDEIVQLASRVSGCPYSAISLVDTDRQWFKAKVGLEPRETPRDIAFCAHTVAADAPLIVPDAMEDERFRDNPLVTGDPSIRFYAGLPLRSPQGFCLGTLCVIDRKPRVMTADELDALRSLARTAVTTLDLHRAMQQARNLAMTDVLTGIANRTALLEAIERAIEQDRCQGTDFAIVYLDLDGFKPINDRLGHAAGDQVLRDVAAALKANCRRGDVAARIGGDEFAVLMCGEDCADALRVGERIRSAVLAAMEQAGWPVTASIGAVHFKSPPADAATVLKLADGMMYAAKTAGKNRVSGTCYEVTTRLPDAA
jgi:diguanylate cyclase (GGDEF)-like protein